ncbi:MAG: hypothetical protein A2X81_12445 [Desulfobacterales bacterium GWB2_56_26]|nr:MAG: hypothetical protein A2X81_12445 [Desulfobacterales bacterium GWB2_56_26]
MAILDDLRRLEEDITATGGAVSGELIIGASTIPGAYILPKIAAAFKNEFPAISFEIRINDSARIVEEVAGNGLLIGIVGAKLPGVKLNYQHFAEDQLILAAAAANQTLSQITMEELCQLPFIVRERGSGTRKSLEMLLARQRYTLDQFNICATLGSSAAVKEAIKADLGVSVISKHAVLDELERGTIREIEVTGWSMMRSFFVVTSPKRTLPHHYQVFLNRLLSP